MNLRPGEGAGPDAVPSRPSRTARALLLSLCALGCLLFAGLGIWQVQRLFWKLDLIERMETRLHAAPVDAPDAQAFAALPPGEAEYRRVRLSGQFLKDRETLVQAVTERGGGFWVLTPFTTDRGFTVLVNRGFVPLEARTPQDRSRIDGPTEITGLLRLSEPGGGFLRSNDPAQERWYSRDVAAITTAMGVAPTVGYFIDADRGANSDILPIGGLTVTRFTNNHLVYALTWFALAAMSAAAAFWVWRRT